MKRIDLTRQRFGRLVVERFSHKEGRKSCWLCRCDCGEHHTVRSDSLKAGLVVSCGCRKREQDATNLGRLRHGEAKRGEISKEYRI